MKPKQTNFKIEHGVPIPPPSRGRPKRYFFETMKQGDSVFIDRRNPSQLSRCIFDAKLRLGNGAQFICRTVEGGCRVWRIA